MKKNSREVFNSKKEADTVKFGKKFASYLEEGDVVGLTGELGAGKTRFIKGAASFFGVKGKEVISPTFTLLKEYSGDGIDIFHFDFYRLKEERELEQIGFRDHFLRQPGSIIFIEWAGKFNKIKRYFTWVVDIAHAGGSKRKITVKKQPAVKRQPTNA
jgi:tRNA threonylcarbamoyladenosine biosynthesis protein TsaE